MASEKRDIIISEGTPIELTYPSGTIIPTIALIGRSSRQSDSITTLESHRRAHFVPEMTVDSGCTIRDTVTNDRYIVTAAFKELFEGEVISIVTHLMLCNTKLTVTSFQETVTDRGDVKKTDVLKYDNLDVFTIATTAAMKQQNTGIFVDAEYMIYVKAVDLNSLDKVTLTAGTRKTPLKVIFADYITFPGLVVIQVCTETRM